MCVLVTTMSLQKRLSGSRYRSGPLDVVTVVHVGAIW